MNRRSFLKINSLSACALFSGMGTSFLNACSNKSPKQPNIVFFFVDDMGWQDTSEPFHTELTKLNRSYTTPNMERLADQGMKFTDAYACSLCSPSRISLMTGLNAARHKVTNWTLRKNKSPDTEHPVIQPPEWNLNGMSLTPGVEHTLHANTLPSILRKSGYRTIHVGKGHFGAKGTPGENPKNLGFDINIAGHAAGAPGSYYGKNNFSSARSDEGNIWDVPGLEKYHGQDIYLTEALTLEANKVIENSVKEEIPFYLYMSHYAVHSPWNKDNRYYQKYIDAGLSESNATYASMIEGMDKSLGDIIANIKRLGVEENTIIVFMSDNGQSRNVERNEPLRGHKLTPYEGGVRVPMITKWPGVTEAGSICNEYIIIEDIFPTFLEIAGVEKFEQIGGKIDGVSFVPFLKRKNTSVGERPIFWHFPHTYDQPPFSSVRKGDWKLIYQHVDESLELYNLAEDISEKSNLAESNHEKLNELSGILTNFLKEANAAMPINKTTGEEVKYPIETIN